MNFFGDFPETAQPVKKVFVHSGRYLRVDNLGVGDAGIGRAVD